jgi:hypothetical protein
MVLGGGLMASVPSLGAPAAKPSSLPVGLDEDLLMVFSQPKPGREAGYLRWYDNHLKEFVRIPGVRVAERLTVSKQAKVSDGFRDHLAMYSLQASSAAKLDAEVAARMRDGRIKRSDDVDYDSMFHILYRPLSVPMLASEVKGADPKPMGSGPLQEHRLVVLSNPATPAQEDEYNTWYDHQHMPDVLRVPGFVSAQRFVRIGGDWKTPRYLVIFTFRSRDLAATNGEIGRRIREKITVMSPAFTDVGTMGAMATPAAVAVQAVRR